MKTFAEKLEVESAAWVGEGLISEATRQNLLARHPAAAGGGGRMLAIFACVGGALLIAGVSLVIKANWAQLGDWVKIGGLVTLLVGAYYAGWKLKISPGHYPATGDACLMVGAVFFLLGIALVSQIFHLNSRLPNGVLLWWLGIVAVPWLTRAKGAQFVSVVAFLTWLGMEFQAADSWLRLIATPGRWYGNEFFVFASTAFMAGGALLFLGLALRGTRHEAFAGLHEKLGLGLSCWALFSLGFTWSGSAWRNHPMTTARWPGVVLLGSLVVAAAGWAWLRNREELKRVAGWWLLGIVPVGAYLAGMELGDAGWLWGGLACAALFVLNFGMIRIGLEAGREGWINLGIAGIALNIFTRYFVLFGTMLEGGVFFIVTGVLVLGLGYFLERKRRALVKSVRQEVMS